MTTRRATLTGDLCANTDSTHTHQESHMTEIARDHWGRPLIPAADGSKPVAYTRVSTLAGTLDDTSNLTAWKERMVAVGLAQSPHLLDRVTSLVNLHEAPVDAAKRDLNGIIGDAKSAAGDGKAADTGTALHELTDVLDSGRELKIVPDRWRAHLDTYLAATSHLTMLERELFIVNDGLRCAGTMDRLIRLPDGRVVVGDLKTGKSDPLYPLKVAIQVAAYANGERLDPATGQRSPIHPDLDLNVGLLIHLPSKSSPPTCRLYDLDLVVGASAAALAAQVRGIRAVKARDLCVEREAVTEAVAS